MSPRRQAFISVAAVGQRPVREVSVRSASDFMRRPGLLESLRHVLLNFHLELTKATS